MNLSAKLTTAFEIAAPQWSDKAIRAITDTIAGVMTTEQLEYLVADLEIANEEATAEAESDAMSGIAAAYVGETAGQRDQFANRFRDNPRPPRERFSSGNPSDRPRRDRHDRDEDG